MIPIPAWPLVLSPVIGSSSPSVTIIAENSDTLITEAGDTIITE